MEPDVITIRGACEHNLKSIDVVLPKKQLVVFTGVSGSGKSSLAFDTLYAEGQRRYVESLSAYARQFLGQMEKPRFDAISGLSPTIAIEQKSAGSNPRSTVGTVTEIYDYLRVLFARIGIQHCHRCARAVGRQTPEQIVTSLASWEDGTRFTLLAPLWRNRKGELKGVLDEARKDGFARVRIDGEVFDLHAEIAIDKNRKHDVDLVIDRISLREGIKPRLTESVEAALKRGEGVAIAALATGDGEEVLFSEHNYCAHCDLSFPELSPQLFSFNSPLGMCPTCHGLGTTMEIDPDKLVPDPDLSLDEGAVKPWTTAMTTPGGGSSWTADIVKAVCRSYRIDPNKPWRRLTQRQRDVLMLGADRPVTVSWERASGSKGHHKMRFEGVANTIKRRWQETKSEDMRSLYQDYLSSRACPDCGGARLRVEAQNVRVGDVTLPSLLALPVGELRAHFEALELQGRDLAIGAEVLKEVRNRLSFLDNVGLGYLNLGRKSGSLSGGEAQRIRLASQIGTELTGVIYVLDEPSIGLHQRDNQRLIEALQRLRDLGNSVIVVEHDEEMMRSADWVLDFGPGAGRLGGEIVAAGTGVDLAANPHSPTGAYLSGRKMIAMPTTRRAAKGRVRVSGAAENNLRGIDVDIPLSVFSVVTGVSGAGKSTLVNQILLPALMRRLHGSVLPEGAHAGIEGLDQLDKVIAIDQRPIGRTPRSNPATYTKLFDQIRAVFAKTKEARTYGYGPSRFSFNVKGGRCEACAGDGLVRVEMHFLADVYVTCEECGGKRFNEATLRVRFKGKSIAEVLAMSIDEALTFFEAHPKTRRILQTLVDVGLGYVALGQASTTLSGGEAQRVKLSRELAKVQTGRTLYVLDEPSTGLHFSDIEKLLGVVERLVDQGNTVVMIEHNLDIIRAADHVIDLGPAGGAGGGHLVAAGTPEEVALVANSYTGQFLARSIDRARRAGVRAHTRSGADPPQ